MTMAAAGHAAGHSALSGYTSAGSGIGGNNQETILVLLVVSAGVIFIQKERSGKGQDGKQFMALGIVGFILLLLAQFLPDLALAFTGLFTLAVVLNNPNGIPFVSEGGKQKKGTVLA
jgi:hypothetical protein